MAVSKEWYVRQVRWKKDDGRLHGLPSLETTLSR